MTDSPEQARRRRLIHLALVAFVAMFAQDVLATAMVINEARLNWQLAGMFDTCGWLTWLVSSGLAVETIVKDGWRSVEARTVIIVVSAANFVGTAAGVLIAGH